MIIHIHIPKTGGTSLNEIFKRAFGARYVHVPMLSDGRKAMSPEEMHSVILGHNRARVIAGHPLRYPCPPIDGIQYDYVGILRNPIERVVSLYYYEKRLYASDPNHRSKLVLTEFIELVSTHNYGNSQCKWLHPSGEVQQAQEVARAFTVLGTTEDFDATLMLMRTRLGVPLGSLVQPRLNRSGHKAAPTYLDPETFAYVRRKFQADVELYEFVSARLSHEIAEQGRTFFYQTQALRWANQIVDREASLKTIVRGKAHGAKKRFTPKNSEIVRKSQDN